MLVSKEFKNLKLRSKFKLLAIDVDGTLLFDREHISPANQAALLAVKGKRRIEGALEDYREC